MYVLTEEEIRQLTGKQRKNAQARELSHLGISFMQRRDKSLVVYSKELTTVSSFKPTKEKLPNWGAI